MELFVVGIGGRGMGRGELVSEEWKGWEGVPGVGLAQQLGWACDGTSEETYS